MSINPTRLLRLRGDAQSAKGFSLIELVISLAILGVLAAVAVPSLQLVDQRERERELHVVLRELRSGIDAYKRAVEQGSIQAKPGESGYPKSLADLVDGVEDKRSPTPKKLYFLRRIPRDPFAPTTIKDATSTWGLRSYASPSYDPKEGEDVFDVYSTSAKVGLNGIALRQW